MRNPGCTWRYLHVVLVVAITLFGAQLLLAQASKEPKPVQEDETTFGLGKFGDRHLLTTPDGTRFVVLGVNHIRALQYTKLFKEKYKSEWKRAQLHVLDQFNDWGYTTLGFDPPAELHKRMPYLASKTIASTARYFTTEGHPQQLQFPDVFDGKVQQRFTGKIKSLCEQHRDNFNLIGYCWTDTPSWDLVKSRDLHQTDWVSEIRKLPSIAPGKQRYVQFLRNRHHGQIHRVNAAYGIVVDSFDELTDVDFSKLDLTRPLIREDDEQFLGVIAHQYYSTLGAAHRKFDPRHLVFGDRYILGDHPDEVLKAAQPHIDALAIQPGDDRSIGALPSDRFLRDKFDRLYKLTGKPILICDHSITFSTPQHTRTIWTQLKDEHAAAVALERFLHDAFDTPYIIGYLRCQYIDLVNRQHALRQGLLRSDGLPYATTLETVSNANRAIIFHLLTEKKNQRDNRKSIGNKPH